MKVTEAKVNLNYREGVGRFFRKDLPQTCGDTTVKGGEERNECCKVDTNGRKTKTLCGSSRDVSRETRLNVDGLYEKGT